jgi:hypothetical protein
MTIFNNAILTTSYKPPVNNYNILGKQGLLHLGQLGRATCGNLKIAQ